MFPASALRSKPLPDRILEWSGHIYLMFAASYAIGLGVVLWQNPTPYPLRAVLLDSVVVMALLSPFVAVCYSIPVFLICLACTAYEAMVPAGVRPSWRRSTAWPSEPILLPATSKPASPSRRKPLSDRFIEFMDWPGHPYLMLIVAYAVALGLMLWPDSGDPLWVALIASVPLMVIVSPFVLVFYCISSFLIGIALKVYEAMQAPLPD